MKEPGGQIDGIDTPLVAETPTAHAYPAGQATHPLVAVVPVLFTYVPFGQGDGAIAADAQNAPTGQGVQSDAAVALSAAVKLPAGHVALHTETRVSKSALDLTAKLHTDTIVSVQDN